MRNIRSDFPLQEKPRNSFLNLVTFIFFFFFSSIDPNWLILDGSSVGATGNEQQDVEVASLFSEASTVSASSYGSMYSSSSRLVWNFEIYSIDFKFRQSKNEILNFNIEFLYNCFLKKDWNFHSFQEKEEECTSKSKAIVK
jgi:hypothetical protein